MAVVLVYLRRIPEPIKLSGLTDDQADSFIDTFYQHGSPIFIENPELKVSAYFVRSEVAAMIRLPDEGTTDGNGPAPKTA